MPKSQSSNPNKDGPSFQAPRPQKRWGTAIVCFVLAVFLTVAFFDYDPAQYAGNNTGAATVVENGQVAVKAIHVVKENLVGPFGVYSTYWSYSILGGGAWLIPVFLFWLAYLALRASRRLAGTRLVMVVVTLLCCSGLWAMQDWLLMDPRWYPQGPGGVLGGLLYRDVLRSVFGVFGAGSILVVVYILGILFIFTKDIGAEIDKVAIAFRDWKARRAERRAMRAEERRLRREQEIRERTAARAAAKVAEAAAATAAAAAKESAAQPAQQVGPNTAKLSLPKSQEDPLSAKLSLRKTPKDDKPEPIATDQPKADSKAPAAEAGPKGRQKPVVDTKELAVAAAGKIELNIVTPEETKKARSLAPQRQDADYEFPPLPLLREPIKPSAENSFEEHRNNAENLLRILSEFGVEVSLGEIHVGPVITRYEVAPAPGVRVEKISGLDKNIALGMRAQSVRILAPIPGKAAVGVEVPNQHPTPVGLREIFESEDWVGAKAEIPIALGKDVSGKPLISDLTKMPHLLIAGATGSGKSVCINAIVASILYSKSPKDLRLLMVDPKVVELKIFNSLPHMLIPVVTEPKKVPAALKWLLKEMEKRYQIFAKSNVRNIIGFNNRKRGSKSEEFPQVGETQATLEGVDPLDEIEIPDRLPYIVAIIDELADLMMVAPAEIETSIARLAQLARAAGIHLIIATQRPSVNVITGVIKANLPSRIAFQVASQVDSRTIIDTKGADTLIGRGDMLFTPPGTSRLVRAQGAFVGDEEISAVVDFLKRNGPPTYAMDVQAHIDRASREDDDEGGGDDDGELGDDDELYQQALDVLKSSKRASTSMLQRRLRIGYNRAARIMEIMEERGIVGPENGSSPREILVDLDSL